MRKNIFSVAAVDEIQVLQLDLASAPGVVAVKSIQPHRKGGYVVAMEISWESLDGFLTHLDTAGWMSVI